MHLDVQLCTTFIKGGIKMRCAYQVSAFSTPTFIFAFSDDVSKVTDARLTLKLGGEAVVQKDYAAAIKDTEANTLSFTLTQEDTGSLPVGVTGDVVCDWMMGDVRGRRKPAQFVTISTGFEEVL